MRVQVKSTVAPRRPSQRGRYKYEFLVGSVVSGVRRKMKKEDCDVVALVALDKRLCQFMRVEECTRIHWRILPEEFTVENQARTLREVFKKYER